LVLLRKLKNNDNYAFIASTLPIHALNKNMVKWNIKEILLASEDLRESYDFLIEKYPNVTLIVIPKKRFLQLVYLFWRLLIIKISSKNIYFFHECCWVVFDLLITITRPRGQYLPQVTMNCNPIQKKKHVFKNKLLQFLTFFWFHKLFNYHREVPFLTYCFSIKKYPKSIHTNEISKRLNPKSNLISKKILFILGKTFEKEAEISLLNEIFGILTTNGYECILKDHPRESVRLNITNQFSKFQLHQLNPKQPIELIEDDYLVAIGEASTSLVNFGNRAISLTNLLININEEDRALLKKHLRSIPGGNDINYINSVDEVLLIIKNNEASKNAK
jgi:hypothetical protein